MKDLENARSILTGIADNICRVIVGKRLTVELVVQAMACGGHVLIEDIPGVGKTSLVSALARSVKCGFKRIQFTPDIMPSDITGFSIFNPGTGGFEFRPGAVMSNFVLADEINRTSPKTQASLLEVMEEGKVTVDLKTYETPKPFMVLATQNPVEYLGTYPLPEAEIDRFIIKVTLGYPEPEEEVSIIGMSGGAADALSPVADASDVLDVREAAADIYVHESIRKYIVNIVGETRRHKDITLGASPRGSISLFRMAQARALFCGRDYVLPDDVKTLAPFVLCHRLILSPEAKLDGRTAQSVMQAILSSVSSPSSRVRHI